MPDISAEIKILLDNVAEIQKLVFFVGAGVSIPAGYPLWSAATRSALDKAKAKGIGEAAVAYAREKYEKQQYYDVFEILQNELPESTFYEIAEEVFRGGNHPAENHRLLVRLGCRGVITTNFDSLLEIACAQEGKDIPKRRDSKQKRSARFRRRTRVR